MVYRYINQAHFYTSLLILIHSAIAILLLNDNHIVITTGVIDRAGTFRLIINLFHNRTACCGNHDAIVTLHLVPGKWCEGNIQATVTIIGRVTTIKIKNPGLVRVLVNKIGKGLDIGVGDDNGLSDGPVKYRLRIDSMI